MFSDRYPLDMNDVASRYLSGIPEYQLALDLGITRHILKKCLLEHGVPRRGIGEANALRQSKLTPSEHRRNASAAQAARRGQRESMEVRVKHAALRSQRGPHGSHVSPHEDTLAPWLDAAGIHFTRQHAVGPYNLDFALGSVAVELELDPHHPFTDRHLRQRAEYLLDQGWQVLYVWLTKTISLEPLIVDEIMAFQERARRLRSGVREYWIMRGDGELVTAGRIAPGQIARIPAPVYRGRY